MKKRILVIDDDPEITRLLKLLLESRGEYQVFEENNASRAINTARRCDPDVIILDVMMPGRNGIEVAADLHEEGRLGEVPILFLTGLDSQDVSDDLHFDVSQRHYMSKPVDMDELVKRIEGLRGK